MPLLAAGFSLTDRRVASQVLSHHDSARHRQPFDTVGRNFQHHDAGALHAGNGLCAVMQQLRDAGWPDDMPCAIVSHVSGKELRNSLDGSGRGWVTTRPRLPAPAIMVVGRVVAEVAEEIGRNFNSCGNCREKLHDRW